MSGGHFDYDQYKIQNIIDSVEQVIQDNKRVLTDKELQEQYCIHLNDYKTPESRMKYNYPDDIIEEFKKGVEFLKIAQIYAQRIDWLLSGDDGENSFRTRLKEELSTNSTQKELISKKDIIDYLNYIVDVVENKNIITNDLVQKVNALEEKYNTSYGGGKKKDEMKTNNEIRRVHKTKKSNLSNVIDSFSLIHTLQFAEWIAEKYNFIGGELDCWCAKQYDMKDTERYKTTGELFKYWSESSER